MFGDLNDCYGKALQQEIAESNRLEQELIEAGNRYAEMNNEAMIDREMNNEEWCKKNCPYYPDCSGGGVCNTVLSLLKEQEEKQIVRCKECVHYRYYGLDSYPVSECKIDHEENPDEEWFCADGKREN